ncbi:MAG: hypothetical protein BAJATHORv1_30354 [Candidatus Thorarchaeota archaeon]|nr:MAG: hypothetical protein BAJATHORv1_30354 [Candidatus Thorarchaeota archaeon]
MKTMLTNLARTIGSNLQYSFIYRVIQEISRTDSYTLRQKVQKKLGSEEAMTPIAVFESIREYYITRGINDESIAEQLLKIPKWIGYRPVFGNSGYAGDEVFIAAKNSALATLWLAAIPNVTVSRTALPGEYREQDVETLVSKIIHSPTTRREISLLLNIEFERRGMNPSDFAIEGILDGFEANSEISNNRRPILFSLFIMISTCLELDLDQILILDEKNLARQTASFIYAKQTMEFIRSTIQGSDKKTPFDWPIVGSRKICNHIFSYLDTLRDFATDAHACKTFETVFQDQSMKMTEIDFIMLLLDMICDHYEGIMESKKGRGKQEDLQNFIKFIRGERGRIAQEVIGSDERGVILYNQLQELKRRAKAGHKPYVSPEKKYRDSLNALELRVKMRRSGKTDGKELVKDVSPVFDAITEIINKNKDILREDTDQFTEALCFETCFRILEYLDLGHLIMDLPWVCRFIAEEAVKGYTMMGIYDVMSEEHRTERIVAAFMGGITYLVLQSNK